MTAAILMYHRICPRTPATECYFARGTAVTPEAFRAQMLWLRERSSFRTVGELAMRPQEPGPIVALTFDDGYQDVLDHALPVCRELGVRATAYLSACTIEVPARPLWFDRYYAAAAGITATGIWPSAALEIVTAEIGEPPRSPDLRWWVRGPLKEKLKALDRPRRFELLSTLAPTADSAVPMPSYLDRAGIDVLVKHGWEVGGHGATHERLCALDDQELTAEMAASASMLQGLHLDGPWSFAYPDGDVDERVAATVRRAGFVAAVTVQEGWVEPTTSPHRLPRLLGRGDGPVPHPALVALRG